MFGCPETDPLSPDAYRPDVSSRVYGELMERAIRTVSAGLSVIVDATFMNTDARGKVESEARRAAVEFVGIFLTADLETRVARIKQRGADASDADVTLAREQEGYQLGDLTWTRVDASGTVDQTLERSRAVVSSYGTRTAAP
jgi:predicted kinase